MKLLKTIQYKIRQVRTKQIADNLEVLLNEKDFDFAAVLKEFEAVKNDLYFISLIENYGHRQPWENPFRINGISLARTLVKCCSKSQILDLNLQLDRQGITKKFIYSPEPINVQ